ncbi:MAG TPA: hypothetical protein ENH20_01485, partial [Candidatus Pacearchaeota archaeon]|nr:hypothetical protein [Candidatus Pacearchaeota archaeon]
MFNIFRRKHLTGVIAPDPKDPRDYQLADIQETKVELPEEFDLRDKMTPVGIQKWGSCTSWGTCAVKEYWDSKQYNQTINLSEKFVYHNTKKISGLWNIQGDYVVNAIKSVCKYGAPLLKDYPDTRELTWNKYVHKEPSPEVYGKAEKYKGKTYWSVGRTLNEFRSAIYQNRCPVIFGMEWYLSYNRTDKDGKLRLPVGKPVSGHALACAGWTKDKLWVKNSWGTRWGKNGYFYIPFDEFEKYNIWNARVLLDEGTKPIEGWVAVKFLRADKYTIGTTAKTTDRKSVGEG